MFPFSCRVFCGSAASFFASLYNIYFILPVQAALIMYQLHYSTPPASIHTLPFHNPYIIITNHLLIVVRTVFRLQKLENSQSNRSKKRQIHGEFAVAILAIQNQIHLSGINPKHHFYFQQRIFITLLSCN